MVGGFELGGAFDDAAFKRLFELPNFFLDITGTGQGGSNNNFPFGGTAVLIMVGVGLDTVKQIESQLMQRNYEGFLR